MIAVAVVVSFIGIVGGILVGYAALNPPPPAYPTPQIDNLDLRNQSGLTTRKSLQIGT